MDEQLKYQLISDDNEINRMIIKIILERNNFKVDEADDGTEVIKMIKDDPNKFRIIWMDVDMPNINGIECTKILKNDLKFSGIIIGITGYVDFDSFEACKKAGMIHVLAKPITEEILLETINKFLY